MTKILKILSYVDIYKVYFSRGSYVNNICKTSYLGLCFAFVQIKVLNLYFL